MSNDVMLFYSENIASCANDLQLFLTMTDNKIIQGILQYHDADEIINYKDILKSVAMLPISEFAPDSIEIYIQDYSTLLQNNEKLQNKLQGGGDPKAITNAFIAGLQPTDVRRSQI